jgi:hypothetical protein
MTEYCAGQYGVEGIEVARLHPIRGIVNSIPEETPHQLFLFWDLKGNKTLPTACS